MWARRNDTPVVLPGLMRVCGRQEYDFVHAAVYLCASAMVYTCGCVRTSLFSTGRRSRCCCRAFGNLSRPCQRASVCVCVFELLFNFYFLFYSWPNPNATQLCSQPERKRAWGMGCQDLVSAAMLYNCYQQMEGKWGYQLGLIFSL